MDERYEKQGFVYVKQFFDCDELTTLKEVLKVFHQHWLTDNQAFYHEKAVNSAYLTDNTYLNHAERNVLFNFIGSNKLMSLVKPLFNCSPAFMGTQLFFYPYNPTQNNYWHRDPQYHLTEQQQKQALSGPDVVHIRIPLFDEPGLELVPGTHKRWDTTQELNVRLEREQHRHFEDLDTGLEIPLNAGDVLIFSANMIHRGLYGGERLAFDVLFCEPEPELLQFVKPTTLPDDYTGIEDASAFDASAKLLRQIGV